MAEEQPIDFSQLVARALANVHEDDLRQLMAEAVVRQLGSYDCKQIFEAVVRPIVSEVVKQQLQKPDVQQLLQERVRGEVNRLLMTLGITTGTTWR